MTKATRPTKKNSNYFSTATDHLNCEFWRDTRQDGKDENLTGCQWIKEKPACSPMGIEPTPSKETDERHHC